METTLPPPHFREKPSLQFWFLCIFVVIVFMMGGSSRLDVQSLVILNPISIFTCMIAAFTLRQEHLASRRWLFVGVAAVFTLAALHLVPLPSDIRSLIVREEMLPAGLLDDMDGIWQPITATPEKAWEALVSLFVPLAVLLLGVQLSREDLYRLLPLILGLGAISGLVGILQITGSQDSPLYLYRITGFGNAVGLFANRNHAAVFLACLFPMLAVLAKTGLNGSKKSKSRSLLAAAMAIVLVPLILVTGSRSGVLIAIIGLLGGLLLYQSPANAGSVQNFKMPWKFRVGGIIGASIVLSLGFITIFFSRAVAIERFLAVGTAEDNRADFWAVSFDILWRYFPTGSGSGSFSEIYQVYEPTNLLDSTYLNNAHNDWIQIALTFGLPGLLLAATAVLLYIYRTYSIWRMDGNRRSVIYSRLASICLAMFAMASISDYPVRTPALSALVAILVLWFLEADKNQIAVVKSQNT